MNTAVIRLTNCHDCPYCDHNGMLQSNPKYLCRNNKVYGRNKVNAKYWYDQPVLAAVNSKTGKQIDIPDWCPILESSNENKLAKQKGGLNEKIFSSNCTTHNTTYNGTNN